MSNIISWLYSRIFARPCFATFNRFTVFCGLRALGVENSGTIKATGESTFLRKLLRHKNTLSCAKQSVIVFDVGAHNGEYAQGVLAYEPLAQIYAFEPHPSSFARLCANMQSQNVHCYDFAIGSQKGLISLYDTVGGSGSELATTIVPSKSLAHCVNQEIKQVRITTIDDFMLANSIPYISLLKLDIEGAEYSALVGARNCIKNGLIDVIQFEFNSMNIQSRVFYNDYLQLLSDYRLFRILPRHLLPLSNYYPMFCEIFEYQNLVAIRRDLPALTY